MMCTDTVANVPSLATLQAKFLAILPKIEIAGLVYFRNIRCRDKKQDCLNEMVALAWKWFVRLAQRGKDATIFPTILGEFAARAVNSGRRLCGQEKAKDAMSRLAQQRHGFAVESIPDRSCKGTEVFNEALQDNMQTPVPDQAAFRLDFPEWRKTRTKRDRRIMEELMVGGRTKDVSRKYGISPARVSQLRQDFYDDWEKFCAAPAVHELAAA